MLITITSAGWRLQGSDKNFDRTRALSSQSHLELNWFEDASEKTLTEVWVNLYFTEDEPVRKLMMYHMDAQNLEWQFAFDALYDPLIIEMNWNRLDEQSGEVMLINRGVPRSLLKEIGTSAV